ncbi:MAG: ABC transporter permease [Dehalococcoidia bacterium]|nr:MAG: ABC transporter permease [Dehalococcoidia bacterium]
MTRILFSSSLKMLTRDRQALFWALIFPLMFLGVFKLFSGDTAGTTHLIVSVDATSERGRSLVEALGRVGFLEVDTRPGLDEDAATRLIEADEGDAALVVFPAAPSSPANAVLLVGIRDPIGRQVTAAAIASVVDGVNLSLTRSPASISLVTRPVDEKTTSFFQFVAPGILGMGLMNFATISLSGSLSRYREEGVLRRIRATPLPPSFFFLSVLGAHLVITGLQVAVLMVVGQALGADLFSGGIWAPLIAIFGTVVFLNVGVIVAGRVKGRGAVEGAANAITLPMMFLSGSFFPVSALPEVVQKIVQVLPLTHMLSALRGVTIEGESIAAQWPSLLVMLGWTVASFVAARFAFSLDDA